MANSQVRPGEPSQLLPIDGVSSAFPLSDIPRGGPPPVSKQETHRIQRVEALKDLNRLLELVTEQDKKYGSRLSTHSNFYRRHLMVQQFIQSQLKSQPRPTRRSLSLGVARNFGRGSPTARNIVRWENMWVDNREIPERKGRDDHDSWMYDLDLNDAMRKFAATQGDSKYRSC